MLENEYVTPDCDIVDVIDELVDWQLSKEPSVYDRNVNQARCPHWWCDADFHPLPIKKRMREIRRLWQRSDSEWRPA
ncbi:hypothetical protein [Nocardia sp. NPDC050717]|uniref:hypothetical protein n=1 Tax=Nocardia sp. NPDC050717 TaxID=3157221 RepID=UPI00340FEE6E